MTETPQVPQPQVQPPVTQNTEQSGGKGLAIAAMVLGIVGAALWCMWFLAIPCAILAVIFGIISRKKAVAANQGTGMATAGLVLGIIGIAIWIVLIILAVVAGEKVEDGTWEFNLDTDNKAVPVNTIPEKPVELPKK